jgi:hypothetical protein
MTQEKHFLYQFHIILLKNDHVDLDILRILLTEAEEGEDENDLSFEGAIDERYT